LLGEAFSSRRYSSSDTSARPACRCCAFRSDDSESNNSSRFTPSASATAWIMSRPGLGRRFGLSSFDSVPLLAPTFVARSPSVIPCAVRSSRSRFGPPRARHVLTRFRFIGETRNRPSDLIQLGVSDEKHWVSIRPQDVVECATVCPHQLGTGGRRPTALCDGRSPQAGFG
jgi:hypothetical protein